MIRVFPRKTNATPTDEKCFFDGPPLFRVEDNEGVYVSCTFTWDKPRAEWLCRLWQIAGYEVRLGGPAYDARGGEFIPGQFLKHGYTITSRGCNNNCWFCFVPKREGVIRELPIYPGNNLQDNNLLQCSRPHIERVFQMLKQQKDIRITGGLDVALLDNWHIEWLESIKPTVCYFAYDTPGDLEPLRQAAKRLKDCLPRNGHWKMCYVLIGYEGDNFDAAEKRFKTVMDLGFTPMAMLYRDAEGQTDAAWRQFQRVWARPMIIHSRKELVNA